MKNAVDLKDFSSLQEAVDAVPEYGTLIVPPGRWAYGSARLKSNMTLHLQKGAVLLAPETIDEHIDSTCVVRRGPLK